MSDPWCTGMGGGRLHCRLPHVARGHADYASGRGNIAVTFRESEVACSTFYILPGVSLYRHATPAHSLTSDTVLLRRVELAHGAGGTVDIRTDGR